MSQQAIPAILAAASRYTALQRVGDGLYFGACPYPDHREPEPVFRLDTKSGYCLCAGTRTATGSPRGGCGRGGNVVSLIKGVEGVTRQEAKAMLDELQGGAGTDQRMRVRRALEFSGRYARKWLVEGAAPDARQARAYIEGRGLGAEVLAEYGVGYIPRKGIATAARKSGIEYADLIEAGVLSGAGKEMFAGRMVWPVRDALGRVVGFGGRILPGSKSRAKYLNSPQGDLFDKGALLYGLDIALPYIRHQRRAMMVEGYTDVLALSQAGAKNVVATLGTAITERHIRALSPYVDEIVLVFDPDAAGVAAALKAVELRGSGPSLSAVILDADPADFADSRGAVELREALAASVPVPVSITRARAAGGKRTAGAWEALEAFASTRLITVP